MWEAARLAKALGIGRISAIEFGVAGGNGLVAMEGFAARVKNELGVETEVYGFDLETGLPPSDDYRDLPYAWRPRIPRSPKKKLQPACEHGKLAKQEVRNMASVDFLVQDEQTLHDICLATSECLGIEPSEVFVIQDLSDYPPQGSYKAVCKVVSIAQGMKQMVTVDYPDFDPDRMVEYFSKRFHVACLTPTKDLDPYRMNLFSPDGQRRKVAVDPELLDDFGYYQIIQ